MTEPTSKCCGVIAEKEVWMRYGYVEQEKDIYTGRFICSQCHKPCEITPTDEGKEEG